MYRCSGSELKQPAERSPQRTHLLLSICHYVYSSTISIRPRGEGNIRPLDLMFGRFFWHLIKHRLKFGASKALSYFSSPHSGCWPPPLSSLPHHPTPRFLLHRNTHHSWTWRACIPTPLCFHPRRSFHLAFSPLCSLAREALFTLQSPVKCLPFTLPHLCFNDAWHLALPTR